MTTTFAAGYDLGYADALDRGTTPRMSPAEYFWNYEFRFDLRDATRSEQEAIRVLFLAQKIALDGFTARHCELVELVLGSRKFGSAFGCIARQNVECGYIAYDSEVAAMREP